jgi:hypothetical protein
MAAGPPRGQENNKEKDGKGKEGDPSIEVKTTSYQSCKESNTEAEERRKRLEREKGRTRFTRSPDESAENIRNRMSGRRPPTLGRDQHGAKRRGTQGRSNGTGNYRSNGTGNYQPGGPSHPKGKGAAKEGRNPPAPRTGSRRKCRRCRGRSLSNEGRSGTSQDSRRRTDRTRK